MKKLFLILTIAITSNFLKSQVPLLLKDLKPTTGSSVSASNNIAEMNGIAYFTADDGTHGIELWHTDGSPGGTYMVVDLDTFGAGCGNVVAVFNNRIYFWGKAGEPYQSDGTAAGTFLLKDINAVTFSSPTGFTVCNNKLYFVANDGTHGREMWVSDGTTAGTFMLLDFSTGTASGFSAYIDMMPLNGLSYFLGFDATYGGQMWVTDGTTAGTHRVTYIRSTTGGGYFYPHVIYNNMMYSNAIDSAVGDELFISDGTTAGTHLVKDINPGKAQSFPSDFCIYNNKIYFRATDGVHGAELWVTDGTAANTMMIKDIIPGSAESSPTNLYVYNNKLFFVADDSIHGRELWSSDGTAANTQMVKDINPKGSSSIKKFATYNDRLYYIASNGVDSFQLHQYVGLTNTESQITTTPLTKNALGESNGNAGLYTILGGLYYPAIYDPNKGEEIYHFTTTLPTVGIQRGEMNISEVIIYPNPVRNSAIVKYSLIKEENITLTLSDITGKTVHTFFNERNQSLGKHEIQLDIPAMLPAGIYVLNIFGGMNTQRVKLIKL